MNAPTNNICQAIVNLEEYLNSCINIEDSPYPLHQLFRISEYGPLGADYALKALKNSFNNNGLLEYIIHPQKMTEDAQRLPKAKDIPTLNIPQIFQTLWITSKEKPHPINHQLENFISQAEKLDGYKIAIWTNIEPSKLKELNPILEKENIEVYNIAHIDTEYQQLLDFILSPNEYVHNVKIFNGVIIDIAKNIIMESTGGFLVDLNFELDDNFNQSTIQSYDFITHYMGFNIIENGFFIAKPHHIIFKEMLNIQEEMMLSPECSLKELKTRNDNKESIFSMTPLMMAYLKYNNLEGNIDAVTPHDLCFQDYQPNMNNIQAHEAMYYKLESNNPEEIKEYAISLFNNINYGICFTNVIKEPIGLDIQGSRSWEFSNLS